MKRLLAMALVLGLIPAIVQAQPAKTDWELTLSGTGSNDKEFVDGAGAISANLGYFLTDEWEVSLRQTVSIFNGNGTDWSGSTRVALDYHFNLGESKLFPFIGVNTGLVYGSPLDETWEIAPEAGVKYYVKDKTFIYGMAEYQFFFDKTDQADEAFSDGMFVYSIGIGFNF